ncbi:MAG: hypothetical protein EZS28_035012, partial [Streblomastix strix]
MLVELALDLSRQYTLQSYQGRDICTVNSPPLYTLFCHLNSEYFAMFRDDETVHFTTQAT